MALRSRIRLVAGGEGTYRSTLSIPQSAVRDYTALRSQCVDTFGAHDSAFQVDHAWCSGQLASFRFYPDVTNQSAFKEAVNFPLGYFQSFSGIGHQTISGQPSNSFLAVQLLAATSPSRPVVDLPVSFLELRELPSLVKTLGDTLIKTWAKKNLNREFGLTPLMADALALLEFSADVKKRVELFKKLREKPLLRKATLWKGSLVTEPNNSVTSNSSPTQVNCTHVRKMLITNKVIGGYVTWTPDDTFNKTNLAYADPALEYLARRAVTGTQLGLVTAWNAVPWTWLFDWFGNIGDWLEANRQVVPTTPSLPRLTIRTETSESWVLGTSNFGFPPGSMPISTHTLTKARVIASATLPSAYMPLLTGRQVGILASLAALRT